MIIYNRVGDYMKCDNCGAELYKGDSFCTHCGKKIPVKEEKTNPPVVEQKEEIKPRIENTQVVTDFEQIYGKESNTTPSTTPATTPVVTKDKYISKEDNDKANMLCIIALLLYFVAPAVLGGLDVFLYKGTDGRFFGISSISSLCGIAAIILVIVARVKYPNNTFAKVLSIILGVLLVLGILAIIVLIISCYAAISSCSY